LLIFAEKFGDAEENRSGIILDTIDGYFVLVIRLGNGRGYIYGPRLRQTSFPIRS
jgi:hypothetical protein